MNSKIDGYNCSEYFDEYYSFGLFNGTEAQMLYPNESFLIDEEKKFLRIGEVYDDHDLFLGYKKEENGIWAHYNNHWNGTYQIVSSSLKELCEGWYQKGSRYWCGMHSQLQWNEISNFFKVNIYRYQWEAEKVKEFIDYCIKTQQLTGFYIKAYKTLLGITQENGFCKRSFTNMVYVKYELDKKAYIVYFNKDFFDNKPKAKEYSIDNIEKAIVDIIKWIKNTA